MKALSIMQPWAWCIIRPDVQDPAIRETLDPEYAIKPIENRTWASTYRGQLLIHASKNVDHEAWGIIQDDIGLRLPPANRLALGGFIGVVDMIDCVEEYDNAWFAGPFGFVFANPRPIPFVPYRGQLQIFDVADSDLLLKAQDTLL